MAGNSVNFYDYATEDENFKRRQAIVDAMQQQSMTPMQPVQVGGMGASPTLLGVIAKVLQARQATQGQEQLRQDRTAAAERFNTGMREGFENFQRTAEGYSAPSMAQIPNADGTPQQTAVPGDRRKAIFDALASGHPVLRDFAMKQLAAEGKDSLHPKELLPYADPSSIPAIVQKGVAGFIPKKDIRTLDKTFYDVSGGAPKAVGGTTYSSVPLPHGLGQRDNVTGELSMVDKSPKVNVNASPVVMGQKAGAQEYFKNAAQQVGDMGKQANASQQLISTIDTLQKLHQAGINSNVTSGVATTLQNLGQQLGVKVDPAKLANTETYNSLITDLWQRSVSQYGGNRGVTQSEAEEIKKLTPLASSSPAAREQLFAIQKAIAQRNIAAYQEANKSFAAAAAAEDPRLFKIPDYIQGSYLPNAAETPAPDVSLQTSDHAQPSWLPQGFRIRSVKEK